MTVELYINEDKALFNSLLQHKDDIESKTGLLFDWRELPEKKASRIVVQQSATLGNQSKWSEQFTSLVDVMLKMKKEFKKRL